MARQGKAIPGRKARDEESLLLRSAESLGRMIGLLQRQLDGAARSMAATTGDALSEIANGNGVAVRGASGTPRKAAKATKMAAVSGKAPISRRRSKTAVRAASAPAATATASRRPAKPKTAMRPAARKTAAKGPRGR